MIAKTMPKLPIPFMHPVVLFPRIVLLLTLIDLLGWTFQLRVLTSLIPGFSTMKPNTAVALGLLAVCCRARVEKSEDRPGRLGAIPRVALAIAMVLSCGSLAEYASGRSFGLDGLIMGVPLDRFGDPPGRMAFGTALCISLTGMALGVLDKAPRSSVWLLLTTNVIAVTALLGFVANRGPIFNVFWLRSLSVPTALCLVILAVAALASRSERRPISFLFSNGVSAGKKGWVLFYSIALALLVALPSVVAMRTGIPEASATFLGLALSLYSAESWYSYVSCTRLGTARTSSGPEVDSFR